MIWFEFTGNGVRNSVKQLREADLLLIELVKPVSTLLLIIRDLLDWEAPVKQNTKHHSELQTTPLEGSVATGKEIKHLEGEGRSNSLPRQS